MPLFSAPVHYCCPSLVSKSSRHSAVSVKLGLRSFTETAECLDNFETSPSSVLCPSLTFHIFNLSSETAERNSTKPVRKISTSSTKFAILWLAIFRGFPNWNCHIRSYRTWIHSSSTLEQKGFVWQAKVDKNGVFSNITNSFCNITNSFSNNTNSFSNITNSFINITNSFSNITN